MLLPVAPAHCSCQKAAWPCCSDEATPHILELTGKATGAHPCCCWSVASGSVQSQNTQMTHTSLFMCINKASPHASCFPSSTHLQIAPRHTNASAHWEFVRWAELTCSTDSVMGENVRDALCSCFCYALCFT